MSRFSRREFIFLGAAGLMSGCRLFTSGYPRGNPVVRFGLVTDLHYALIDPDPAPCGVVGRRYYRESLRKLREAVDVFNGRDLDFAIELGDFKDNTRGKAGTLACLEAIEAEFARFKGPRYHVAGNHDFDCLTPEEFFSRIPNDGVVSSTGYYSFVRGGVTFIVLNACFDSKMRPYDCSNPWDDANVPAEELEWLRGELATAHGDVIVFCHQRLDESAEPKHLVRNAAAVREILERSGKVKGVITGHQHKGGANVVNGIPYYSLRALVCDSGEGNNSFAEMAVYADGSFTVTGWRNAVSRGAKGEFPEQGLAVKGESVSEMIVLEGDDPAARDRLMRFPATGIYLNIHCKTGSVAPEVAVLLRNMGRLAQGILMMDSRKDLVALKAKCPWVKTGLVMNTDAGWSKPWTEAEAWRKLKDAAAIGVEFVQILPESHVTREQLRFLHDRGISTIYFFANDAQTLKEIVLEGHDFIFTDCYSEMRPVYNALRS